MTIGTSPILPPDSTTTITWWTIKIGSFNDTLTTMAAARHLSFVGPTKYSGRRDTVLSMTMVATETAMSRRRP